MNDSKRAIIAALTAVTVFGTVFAVAASLNVTAGELGAGSATVSSCTASVTTTYDTTYSATVGAYKVTTVHVSGLSTPACDGKSLSVSLVGASDVKLAEKSMTLATPAADPSDLNFASDNVAASAVVKVTVVVSG